MTGSYSLYRCAVLSTSSSMLDSILDRNSPIHILRLTVRMGGETFADGLDLKAEQFYDRLREHPEEKITTSPPDAKSLHETFAYLKSQGYEEAIVTTISGRLSETAAILRQVADETCEGFKVHVVDTGTTCTPEGFFALEAVRLLKAGKTPEETVAHLERLKPRCEILFGVHSLKQFTQSGGLLRMGAAVNDWLGLKAVMRFNHKGTSHLASVQDDGQLVERLIEALIVITADKNPANLVISGGYCGDYRLYQQFAHKLHAKTGLHLEHGIPVSPAVGAYVGLNALGVGIVERLPE